MKLVTGEVGSAVSKLQEALTGLTTAFSTRGQRSLSSFSQVSGLDQSGTMHGLISSASEPEATKGLAQHFANVVDLLTAQLLGYQMMDMNIADVLGNVGTGVAGAKYEAVANDVRIDPPVVNPFDATNPVAGRPWSLEALNAQLLSTDNGSMAGISQNWVETARTISEAIGHIPSTIADLSGSAETESIQRAMAHLGKIEAAGGRYVANAGALAAHTGSLVTVSEANALQAAAVLAVVRSTPNAAVAKALEEAFLASFSPKLTTELVPVTPVFRQLLPPLDSPSGGSLDTTGPDAGTAPGFDNSPLPKVVQQALANAGYRDLAYAGNPAEVIQQFGRPNPDMLESIAAGATQTQAASAAAPSLPALAPLAGAASALGGGLPGSGAGMAAGGAGGASGLGAAPLGLAGGGGFAGPQGGGKTGVPHLPSLSGGVGGSDGARGGLTGSGMVGTGSRGANPRLGAGGGMSAGRVGGFGAGGIGAGAFAADGMGVAGRGFNAGGYGTGAGAGFAGGAPGYGGGFAGGNGAGAGTPGSTNVVANGNGSGATRGGAGTGAYGGAHGGANNGRRPGKKGKIQALTSAVEREGNLKALLGEAPEVVPGVIGAWVREPRN